MKHIPWEKTSNNNKGEEGGSQFLKLKAGETYKVRLVGRPVGYLQHWEPVICRSPGKDPETKQIIDPLWLKGHEPKERYAIWVLDRKDNNGLKVMDFPGKLLDLFVKWKDEFQDEPGGAKGTDWKIMLEVPPGAEKKFTQYSAMNLDRTPFTQEELDLFKKMGGGEGLRAKLAELRRDHTPEEINEMLAKQMAKTSGAATKQATKEEAVKKEQAKQQYVEDKGDAGDLGF